jgi:putative DNA primase/helicase
MNDVNLRAALQTAAAGGFVFPAIVEWNDATKKLDKRPAISGWREVATRDPEQIKKLWATFKEAVPGIELGRSNLFVVDLDRHHGGADGIANFKNFRGNNPAPHCPTTKTPSGGYHLYFRQPEGDRLGNRTGNLPAGVDCRGDGGWTVAPGAVFERWRWVGHAAKVATVQPVPQWIVSAIQARKAREHSAGPSPSDSGKRERAYAERALVNAANKVAATQRGRRNAELNTAAFCMGTLIARGWIGAATVEGRLHDAAATCGLLADDGERAVRSTLKSAIEAGIKEPHPDLKERDKPKGNGAANLSAACTSEQGGKRLIIHRASEINPVAVDWLWPGRLAIGKTTLVGGDPGLGKSQLTTFIAATTSTGGQWPCQEGCAPKRSVIVLCAEDGMADTIVPRLMAAQADREKVTIITAVTEIDGTGRRVFNLSKDLDVLEGLITGIGDVGAVIIDPVDAYLGAGAGGIDSHKNAAVRAVLEPLSELADRLRTAVLAVTHFSKQAGGKAMYRFIGSIAHIGSARVAFAVVADAENEGRVLILHAKNNLAPPQKGLAFRLEQHMVTEGVIGSTVVFESEHVAVTADEALAADRDIEIRTAKEEAADFLASFLAEGPQPVRKIEDEARAAGLLGGEQDIGQSKPFRLARAALGIKPRQATGEKAVGWVWELPATYQMPLGDQMPSKERASDSQRASAPTPQMPSEGQMPLPERASGGQRASAPAPDDYPEVRRIPPGNGSSPLCDHCGTPGRLNPWDWPGRPDGITLHSSCEGAWWDSEGARQ